MMEKIAENAGQHDFDSDESDGISVATELLSLYYAIYYQLGRLTRTDKCVSETPN
jgi:hypothetical protein